MKTRVLLISDIGFQIDHFRHLFDANNCDDLATLTVHCSPGSEEELDLNTTPVVTGLDVKVEAESVIGSFDLVVSYHCRQVFPSRVVRQVRCVNIHPGYNPHNRGWYPGVFSLINGLPAGATIHEIDERIDHGPIIAQKHVEILPEDTSGTVYPKIIEAERQLLDKWFMRILTGEYETSIPSEDGNINSKADYNALKQLDLDNKMSGWEWINHVRALSHPPYRNGYFLDPDTGDKIYVSVNLERGKSEE